MGKKGGINMNRQEIRRAGFLSGIEVDYFGEVISSKMRKFYNSLNKIKGCNLNVFQKVLKECKKNKISNITVLECNKWIGNYGRVLSDAEIINERHIGSHVEASIKYIYNILRGIYNIHNSNKYLGVKIPTNDGSVLYHMFYIPEGFKTIRYGENEEDVLICMANGQLFDIGHSYYYSKQDSRKLKKYLKDYNYISPNQFYNDINEYEYDNSCSEGCPE